MTILNKQLGTFNNSYISQAFLHKGTYLEFYVSSYGLVVAEYIFLILKITSWLSYYLITNIHTIETLPERNYFAAFRANYLSGYFTIGYNYLGRFSIFYSLLYIPYLLAMVSSLLTCDYFFLYFLFFCLGA